MSQRLGLPIHPPPELLNLVCAHVPVGIALFDRELILQHCNAAWIELLMRSADDIVGSGTNLIDLVPETQALVSSTFARVWQGETVSLDAFRVSIRDKVWYWDLTCAPLPQDDAVAGVIIMAVDVTERLRANQELRRHVATRTRELTALHDVMAAANQFLDPERVIGYSLDRVLEVMACDIGAIHLLDSERRLLCLVAARGISHEIKDRVTSMEVERGLLGLTVDRGEPLILPSIANGPRPLLALPANASQSYAGVPLRVKDQVLGVLSVVGKEGQAFAREEVTLLIAIADGIGTALENARLRHQAEQLAIVRERERLARELHDSVTQSLYSLTLLVEAGQRLVASGQLSRVQEHLLRMGEITQQALREMRLLIYQLRPPILAQVGLVRALQRRLDAVERRAGLEVELVTEPIGPLPSPLEEGLYGIAQEALNNTLKHAGANKVRVSLRRDAECVILDILDDGQGFDPNAIEDLGGLGLISMPERAEALSATFTLRSEPGQGTRITVHVDLEDLKRDSANGEVC